jgi:hypothetical protein
LMDDQEKDALKEVVSARIDERTALLRSMDKIRIKADEEIAQAMLPIAERLAQLEAEMTALTAPFEPLVSGIEAKHQVDLDLITAQVQELEAQITTDVLKLKGTVRGKDVMAVWAKGRSTWDTDGLRGYMVADPKIAAFLTIGEPTVSFRPIKGKD